MSELPMRGHFRYLRFKTFPMTPMTPRTPQCEVFCPLLSNSEHSGVPEDSQPPTFPSVGLHPHTWPKWGCDNPLRFAAFAFLYLPIAIELIKGWSAILCTWIIIIKLVNTIWGVPTTLVIVVGNVVFPFNFLPVETPPNPLPNFFADPISIPLLTISMVSTTIVSTLVVIIPTSSDWITTIPLGYLRVSTIVTFDMTGEVMLTWG